MDGDFERNIYNLYIFYNINIKYMIYHMSGKHIFDTI